MRRHFVSLMLAVGALSTVFTVTTFAQAIAPSETTEARTAIGVHDLSGVWLSKGVGSVYGPTDPSGSNKILEPLMTPWGEAKFQLNKPSHGPRESPDSNDPSLSCLPPGVPRVYQEPHPMQIIQTPDRIVFLYEFQHYVRQVYIDGRPHPKELNPNWMGHSIGTWSGDTLVVDSIGFNDKTWIDRVGHPHSEDLHVVERIRRINPNSLQINFTIDDPKTYRQTWTGPSLIFERNPDWELIEDICEDNGDWAQIEKATGMSKTPGPPPMPRSK